MKSKISGKDESGLSKTCVATADGISRLGNGQGQEPKQQWIAEAAYFFAERRGFAPGNDLADWFQAEENLRKGRHKASVSHV